MPVIVERYKVNMKAGILTFHNSNNYGASLQAYALYKSIEKIGIDVEVINYQNHKMQQDKKLKYSSTFDMVKSLLKQILCYNDIYRRKKRFSKFKTAYMNLSGEQIATTEELRILCDRYDRIICGSDQVWNYFITGYDYNFFFEFSDENYKKASYAASFGLKSISSECEDKISNCLKDFSYLSVREKHGHEIVKNLTGKYASVVLDPTFLLNASDWDEIAVPYRKNHDYILIYSFGSKSLQDFALSLSDKTQIPIICIEGLIKNKWNKKNRSIHGLGPREWLGLFQNARYIVTNSFHGTAFAINFNKDFFTELLINSAKVNSRLENILDMFELRSRQVVDGENLNWNKPINYLKVNKKLNIERKQSLDYLKSIFVNKNE